MSSQIPRVVAEWIQWKLPDRDPSDITKIEFGGFEVLKVTELKLIGTLLYQTDAVLQEPSIRNRKLSSSAKKKDRVNFLYRALYRDDNCSQLNQTLCKELRQRLSSLQTPTIQKQPNRSVGSPSSASRPSIPVASPRKNKSSHNGSSSGKKRSRESSSTTTTTTPVPTNHHGRMDSPSGGGGKIRASSSTQRRQHRVNPSSSTAATASRSTPNAAVALGASISSSPYEPPPSLQSISRQRQHNGAATSQHQQRNSTPLPAQRLNFHALAMGNPDYAEFRRLLAQHPLPHAATAAGVTTASNSTISTAAAAASSISTGTYPHHHSIATSSLGSVRFPYEPGAAPASLGSTTAAASMPSATINPFPINPSDPNQPQNATESRLMGELSQMGFTDRQEMINGIRQSRGSTGDEVMLFIITQREEAEESRKEDEVRLLSEGQKREQEQLKKSQRQDQLTSAKTAKDLTYIFDQSWILKGLLSSNNGENIVDTVILKQRRKEFLQLLDLEEKSGKWYQGLPSHYFRGVCNRIQADYRGTMDWLPKECKKLQQGLTHLKEQVGGRPKLFVEAFDEANGVENGMIVID